LLAVSLNALSQRYNICIGEREAVLRAVLFDESTEISLTALLATSFNVDFTPLIAPVFGKRAFCSPAGTAELSVSGGGGG